MTNAKRDILVCSAIVVVTCIMGHFAYIRGNYIDVTYSALIMIHAVVFIILKHRAEN